MALAILFILQLIFFALVGFLLQVALYNFYFLKILSIAFPFANSSTSLSKNAFFE